MKAFVAVIALVGVISQSGLGVSADQGQQPYYFIKPEGVDSAEQCETYATENEVVTFNWPVYTTPGNSEICIYFPVLSQWLLHQGENVDCVGECCRWLPPPANDGTKPAPLPEALLSWYEVDALSECDNDASAAKNPFIIQGGQNGEERSICVNSLESTDTFTKTVGTLVGCSRPENACCAFLTPETREKLDEAQPQ
ncbi:uncharacterized protein LOC131882552 [Tigriopus californicus]|uniref:uncharacterized protein LOC131882552 n=1 Tax=Tigriopus californicus TaxID=6832 RepID=UPI0027DA5DE8|nr:uncharacterized protein LOC131882552 [Tigriopus californicus]|eukprot:TCALIF_08343-PA protein Name:"Protein of unknown function" AED:0.00 eAED:0.00 QI:19/1/1/1/1/1/3/35/196